MRYAHTHVRTGGLLELLSQLKTVIKATYLSGLICLLGSNHVKKRQCANETYLQGGVEKDSKHKKKQFLQ